ncbi:MAG: hypothetical protein SGPRY_012878, partial [Prymnesium sp.]
TAPSVNELSSFPASRTATVSWFANNDPSTFSGFRVTVEQILPTSLMLVDGSDISASLREFTFSQAERRVAHPPSSPPAYLFHSSAQSSSEPDKVDPLSTSATPNLGRYRDFSWTVPLSNGRDIQGYTLRKMTQDLSTVLYDYSWTCAQISCTVGDSVSVTIGSDLDPGDGTYLVPTET